MAETICASCGHPFEAHWTEDEGDAVEEWCTDLNDGQGCDCDGWQVASSPSSDERS